MRLHNRAPRKDDPVPLDLKPFDEGERVIPTVIVALNLGHGLMFAPELTYFPELFGPNVRYTGASLGFQVSAAIGGGFAPLIATSLSVYMGGTAGVSIMLILLALVTLVATLFARETNPRSR